MQMTTVEISVIRIKIAFRCTILIIQDVQLGKIDVFKGFP